MQIVIDIPEHIYEHAKETTEDSRDEFDAMRAIANGTQQESRSEIPNTCGDAISRQAAIEAIEALQRPIMREESNYYQFKFSGMSEAREAVVNLPSVTPQQRTGRWIQKEEEGDAEPFIIWECSECHCVDEDGKPSYKYCPQCGARMEVEE